MGGGGGWQYDLYFELFCIFKPLFTLTHNANTFHMAKKLAQMPWHNFEEPEMEPWHACI